MTVLGRLTLNQIIRSDQWEEHEVMRLEGFGGQVTLAAGEKSVTFTYPQPDTSYYVTLGCAVNETVYWESKTTTGFAIKSSNGASTATVDWHVQR